MLVSVERAFVFIVKPPLPWALSPKTVLLKPTGNVTHPGHGRRDWHT